MPHTFLSDDWFAEVEKLMAEAPAAEGAQADLKINITVIEGPDGERDLHMAGGQFGQGHVEGAPTKLTVPFDVAKAIFIEQDPQAGMQAFMSGKIKVDGDMTKLMAMQGGAGAPSAEQAAIAAKLKEITA